MRGAGWLGLFLVWATIGERTLAEEIVWLHDADAAWKQTVSDRRPLLLFVTRPNCKYCTQMKAVTFADEKVQELVKSGFVPLAIDPTSDPELIKELKITAYPTTLIISPEVGLVDHFKGYLPPAAYQRRLIRSRVQATAARPQTSRR